MAKECLHHCPRILAMKEKVRKSKEVRPWLNFPFFRFGNDNLDKLFALIDASYQCDGPVDRDVLIKPGYFRPVEVIVRRVFCGIDPKKQ